MRGLTIGILGLTFKPNTDDLRDSPAIPILHALQGAGAKVRAHDPAGMEHARQHLLGVEFSKSPYDCAECADALVLTTEWDVYRALDLPRIRRALRRPVIVDLRNIYRTPELEQHGLRHIRVGNGGREATLPLAESIPVRPATVRLRDTEMSIGAHIL